MGSKFLIGAGAWLLGAASATAGSLYAIGQLGHGLVEQHAKQVSVRMVNAELRHDSVTAPSASPVSKPKPAASPKAPHSPPARRSGGKHHVTRAVTYSSALLSSDGGQAYASCSPDGVRLLSVSPVPGFEYRDVVWGPATQASVSFISSSIGMVMKVTCTSQGAPFAQVTRFQTGGGWHHDE